jgi:adenylyltransferase/sulfurtransferase
MTILPGTSACYRCLFKAPPPAGLVPSCQEAGVLGALAGIIGSIQATEALKLILGVGRPLADRLLTYDALTTRFRDVPLRRNPNCPVCSDRPTITRLIEYEQEVCRTA